MPLSAEKRTLIARDGYNCRFCRIPLIRAEIRAAYPAALAWGATKDTQHAAFQAL